MDEKSFLVNKIDSTEEHSTESWNYVAKLLVQANMIMDPRSLPLQSIDARNGECYIATDSKLNPKHHLALL
jgi:hypothetical protein